MKIKYFNPGMPRLWLSKEFRRKLLMSVNLIMIIMTSCLLQVSAAGFAQKFSFKKRNASLQEVFKEIKTQTGYNVLYYPEKIDAGKSIHVNFNNADLKVVLEQLSAELKFSYSIDEKNILIKPAQPGMLNDITDRIAAAFRQDSLTFKGRVLDVFGQPLPGASVKIKGTKKSTFTTPQGNFAIFAAPDAILQISYIGYQTQELQLRREDAGLLRTFNMKAAIQDLGEVAIVSTGYQDLPKERATGSFETVTAKQLEHSVSISLIKRLEGITTSMDFNNQNQPTTSSNVQSKVPGLTNLTIRGKNTFIPIGQGLDLSNNSGQPLVVIDGIASPYSIDNINPNDVESINILKDAAAASIWGSRAANGVIVVKTKKGGYNRAPSVSFNSSVNITDKPDLFYKKLMSTSEFIDLLLVRYNNKVDPAYDPANPATYIPDPDPNTNDLYAPQLPLSLPEEIMNDYKMGKFSQTEMNAKLDALRGNNVRRDFSKYFLRKSVVQSYFLGIDGGTGTFAYRLSGGYDNMRNNTVTSDGNRYTLNYSATVKPLKNLTLQSIVGYTQNNTKDQAGGNRLAASSVYINMDPYYRLADDNGNPLSVIKNYRPSFLKMLSAQYGSKLLDMTYKPLEDMNEGYAKNRQQGINLNLNADYKISPVFSAALNYSYNWSLNDSRELRNANSYYMRELVNTLTTRLDYVDPNYGAQPLRRIIPYGGLYSPTETRSNSQTVRGQLNADKTWAGKHQLSAIAGADVNQFFSLSNSTQYYGYNSSTLGTNTSIPFGTLFQRLIIDPVSGSEYTTVNFSSGISDFRTRQISFYSNAAYTYDRRYTLSASIRKDMSNIFGEGTNKNGAVYYSTGASWTINNEKFYHVDWLPSLQLRATFGFNGNVNASAGPVPIISYNDAPASGASLLPYVTTNYFTNLLYRPEKSGILNVGLSFGTRGNRLSGSMEYYNRKTRDLIKNAPFDPSSGFSNPQYNSSDLRSTGFDLTLNSINVQLPEFSWSSSLLFSSNQVKVTRLSRQVNITPSQLIDGTTQIEGYNLSRMVAYRWAGLDPATGDPMGYINGVATRITADAATQTALRNSPLNSVLKVFGSSVPVYYGAFRNTFNYKGFFLSASLLYKLGYYQRRPFSDIANYNNFFLASVPVAAEFAGRWQKPGDELRTNVPSLTFPTTFERDSFYQNAEINVYKADHIRFQEINLGYSFKKLNRFIKNPRIYANVNNLGIVWRANKMGLDPEVNDYPNPRTYSLGFSASF